MLQARTPPVIPTRDRATTALRHQPKKKSIFDINHYKKERKKFTPGFAPGLSEYESELKELELVKNNQGETHSEVITPTLHDRLFK